jgi:hypothetical protein
MSEMTDYRARVTPDQAWTENGTANVTPEPPFDDRSTRNLPLEHRAVEGDIVIRRSDYPRGLVIIPQGSGASGESAVFPMFPSSGDEIVFKFPGFQATPDGVVFWFIS